MSLPNFGWNSPDGNACHVYVLPKILNLLPSDCKIVLDAGCGNGYIAGKLLERGLTVVGIDASPDGISIARETYPRGRFEIRSVYDDLSDLMNNADLVISSEVIEHLYYPNVFLKNMYTILNPGGWLILTTPYHGWLKNSLISLTGQWDSHHHVEREGGHIKFFSERSLMKLLVANGFSNIKFENAGRLPFLWKSMICRARKIQTN